MKHLWISAAWAGLIALDFTGFGPFLLTQPMVSGPIFGWICGQTVVGVIVGGITQLLWLDVTPVGVGIPFDTTAVALLAIFWGTLAPHTALSQVILALFIAVPFGFVFKFMDFYSRRANSMISRRIDAVPDSALPAALVLGTAGGLLWSWLRYTILFAIFMFAGKWVWMKLSYWPRMTWIDQALTMAVILLPLAGLGVSLELFLSEEPDHHRFHVWKPARWNRRHEDRPE